MLRRGRPSQSLAPDFHAARDSVVLGADVIRVEHPYQVDLARQLGPDVALNERLLGTGYLTQGSNKCSLSLDLRNDLGREVFRRLLGEADVLVENFRPGALDALDLGYDHVRKVNPSLIYVSPSTFGHTGDKRTYRGYDHNVQAPSGMMAMTRQHPTLARRARWRVRSVGRLSTGPTDRRGWAEKERGLRTVAARRPVTFGEVTRDRRQSMARSGGSVGRSSRANFADDQWAQLCLRPCRPDAGPARKG